MDERETDVSVEKRNKNLHVHYRDNLTQSIWVEEKNLWQLVSGIDLDPIHLFDLSNINQGMDRYIPAASVYMLDMPLYQIMEAAKTAYRELTTAPENTVTNTKEQKAS